jgi:D-threonate/D-erythronate kinase
LKQSSASAQNWVLAIADDLTGALEVGACFPGSVVSTDPIVSARPDAPALVIDTETRHLAPADAAAIVQETVLSALRFSPWLIYKKTDSTLRGNIAAEFGALLKALPERALVYSPAYPAMGRTVKEGQLLIHGIPVHQTAFALDTLNPVRSSDIRELMAEIPMTIVDGESTAHIAAAALRILQRDPPPIAAGPAALAQCLRSESASAAALPRLSSCLMPRCLVVNGSTHPVSAQQIEFARKQGCLDHDWIYFEGTRQGEGLELAASTGRQVSQVLKESRFDALIVFGGDTALGIHRAVGSPDFHPCGEIAPGVPVSRCGDLFWITKAGGFGPPDLLCDIRRRLK